MRYHVIHCTEKTEMVQNMNGIASVLKSTTNAKDIIAYHGEWYAMGSGNVQVVQMNICVTGTAVHNNINAIGQLSVYLCRIFVMVYMTVHTKMMSIFVTSDYQIVQTRARAYFS